MVFSTKLKFHTYLKISKQKDNEGYSSDVEQGDLISEQV